MRRAWLVVGTLAATLVTSSACGPLGGSSGSAGSSPAAAATPASGAAPSGAAVVGAAPHASPTGAASGDEDAQFCALAKEKGAQNLEVFDAQSATPEQQHQVLLNIDALTAAAPAEIHADFARFDEFEHKLFDAGGNATGDLAQEAGGEELRDALARIAAYLDTHCGIHA